ncbi:protein transport protein Sec16A isoform X9 [Erpetoichthys calabaricus]|uniref:protein transport protein Sec16A isoform X9 n=1 Tax=Erpetoichthys calabaricus TaxID=27687 RepID=UPI00109FD3DF|nr:protein transport protein Sec16A isoform X9 [Erpetoichthys calabaricus]
MQSPPQTAPAGATGPPPSGGIPNIFRRSSPYNRRANVPVSGSSAPVPPITDPFAYGRQTPQNAVGNPLPKSNPLTVQNQVLTGPPQTVPVQHQMNLDNKQGILPASGLGGVNVFTVNNMVTPVSAVGHNSNLLPMPVSSSLDSGQCNSVESTSINALQIHDVSSEISSRGIASLQNRPSYGHHTRGDLGSYNSTVPSAVPPNSQPSVINWMQDNRPPSDQNYLQPSELHSQNPSVSSITSSFAGAHSQNPFHTEHKSPILLQNASNEKHEISEKAEDNKHLAFQHSKQTFNSDNYFSQNIPEPWISQSVKDQFYHQEGRAEGTPSNSVNRMPDYSAQTGFHVQANHITYETDKGTVGMFFKGDEIENEETLSSESHASNGVSVPELYVQNLGMFSSQVQGQVSAPQVGNEAAHSTHHSLDSSVPGNGNLPLCNEGNAYLDNSSFTNVSQKVTGIHFDNVENLECVPNIEVLPSKPLNVPGIHQSPVENMGIDLGPCSGKPVSGIADSFEAGPNLETPDSVPHTVRSESVSSGYSNVSHSSNSNCRRPQGVVGTFIQQEVAKSTEEVSPNYFEQIDTSPSAEFIEENGPNGVYHKELSQPSTPSPPKPTGVFRASANSSFEPVRSRGVGIKPAEIDKARLVMEKSKDTFVSDASPGNLEHPPDNLETLFMPHPHSSTANTKIGLENVQMVPEKRPSNRAHATRLKCQSPATTLWAQNEMPVLGANILLVPAAPAVHHNLVKQPSTEVIQPPEDGPLEHQLEQQVQAQDSLSFKPRTTLENLENPPTIGTGEYLKQHPNVTKDAKLSTVSGIEQNGQPKLLPSLPSQQNTVNSSQPTTNMYHQSPPPAVFHGNDAQDAKSVTSNKNYPSVHLVPKESLESEASDPPSRYENAAPKVPLNPMYVPPGADLQTQSFNSSLQFPQVSRPGPSHTPQQIYGPPPQQQISAYGYYGGGAYPDYSGGRQGPYPSPYPLDPRTAQAYYKEEQYRRYDRIGQYENYNPTREAERHPYPEQPERPSSRGSQYSDRPPSRRQGHSEDYYQRGAPSAFDYYYGDPSLWDPRYDPAAYDPRYHEYYDPRYWYYDLEAYRRRDPYYSQHYPRREGYDDRWQYDPRYDSSFDDEFVKRREPYGDDCDRRSVHSEHSARSVHSTRSQNSRRSSFSSRSQQSQVYRSQPDLVATGYDISGQPVSGPTNYSYSHYHDNVDGHQGFSEYPYQPGYVPDSTWPSVEQVPPRPATPEKFSIPHMCGRFGPGGQLLKVLPNLPSEGQPALVEIYSMEVILQNTQEQQDLLSFPGPLVKGETHKVDVIKFAQNRAVECLRNECLIDRDSANLIWEFIVLLCRQNGTVVGTDIADLLLREHKSVWLPGKSPNEANLIDFNNEPLDHVEDDSCSGQLSLLTDTFLSLPENAGKETERFRELLLFGRKKDALESAMKHGLWGHALLLASKMDSRTHARVMTRFANSLPINDPLQTVYQLMSGRMPAAATCCGDEKWGDWRPHLAMVLSNLANTVDLDSRTIITMGDTLASKGLIDAAHFCYIMAQVGLGVYTKKSTKLVLIGANHSLPFFKFACNEAIQRTEAYEYAQSLGSQPCLLPNFQVFKFIYACRLAEAGLSSQAFHYCEVISRTVLKHPSYYSPVFISQLIQISEKLRFFDPQLKEKPEQELFIEPDWLVHLRQVDGQIKDGVVSYNSDRATPQQYSCSTPSSEFEHNNQPDVPGIAPDIATDNPLMAEPGPQALGVHLMPAAPSMVLTSGISSVTQPYPQDDRISYYQQPASAVSQEVAFASPSLGSVEGFMASDSVPLQSLPHHSMSPATTFVGPYQTEKQHFHSVPPLLPPGSPAEALPTLPEQECSGQQEQKVNSQPSSPTRSTFPSQGQGDFYDQMAHMAPGRRSRTTSQSSMHMGYGRRSRTTSESSNHSVGRDRSNSASKQPSPPPPSILEKPVHRTEEHNQGSSKGGWFGWLKRRRNNEAHLPDDKNKSIVWDEKKQRWVNLDEPEEESKPPPPPPSGFPKIAHQVPRGPVGSAGGANAGPPVNIFSRKAAGSRGRYVDVLNPGGAGPKLSSTVPAPADLFAPLAPMPIPVNFSAPEDQPKEGTTAEEVQSGQKNNDPLVQPQLFNPSVAPNHEASASTEDSHSGELSRCSSMSSLSREVSQHLNQISCQPTVQGGPPVGGVTFYNPSQFVQQTTQPLGPRAGRINQRRYPTLK